MKKVLIIGYGTRSFLSVIRSFGRKGIIVHAANSLPDDIALHSKYIKKYFQLPSFSEIEQWQAEIIALAKKEKYDLIIPTDDPPIILLQQVKSEIENYCRVYLINDFAFVTTNNKLRSYLFCQSLGIRMPRFTTITKKDNLESILFDFHYPLIIKPVSSHSIVSLEKKNVVKIAKDKDEYIKILEQLFLNNTIVIVQEYFEGVGEGIEVLASQGEILTAFHHIRIHEQRVWSIPRGGASTYRKSQPLDIQLMSEAKKIIDGLNYTGVAMLEFRKNYENGETVLIEINGRFWGSLPLAVASGADFPYYLYQLLVENKRTFPKEYKNNIFCRNTMEDLYWIQNEMRLNKSNLKNELLIIGKTFLEFFNIFLFRERNDTLVLDDPKPALMEIITLILKTVSIFKREIRYQLYSKKIYRKIRSGQFKHALLPAESILFVCTGNICRSPFAEHYSQKIFPKKIRISSCGCAAQNGRKSPPEGVSIAQKFGVDLLNHRAHQITEEMIRNSDVVIVFDELNFSMLLKQYNNYKSKMWFLSEICPDIPLYIEDPFRENLETFEKVYSTIAYCIDKISQYLKETNNREKIP